MKLQEIIAAIRPPNRAAEQAAAARWNSIAKPLHALGLLEDAIIKIAGMTGSAQVKLSKRGVVVMCADNGVVAEGVTQTGSEVTAVVACNLARGKTSVCKMAKVANADVIPVDIGVARDLESSGLLLHKIAYGTCNMVHGPAMTREQALDSLEYGANLALSLAKKGYRILATGEMGIGNTTTSSAMTAVLLGVEPKAVTGRGAGLSSAALAIKINTIERAIAHNAPNGADALDVLQKLGGFDIGGLAGVFLGAAAAGIPVLVDGFISAAAALTAARIAPQARDYMLASHVSQEPAARYILKELELTPFLTCHMSLGEGTGAVAALPILDMAQAVYEGMSTFEEIQIDSYQPQD